MIDIRVLDIKPHPDQATTHPGTWAVQLRAATCIAYEANQSSSTDEG